MTKVKEVDFFSSKFIFPIIFRFSLANCITDSNKNIQCNGLHLIISRNFLISTCLENIQHCKHMHYVLSQRQVYNFQECNINNDMLTLKVNSLHD